MPIYDNNGAVNAQIGKIWDNDGTTNRQIGEIYDNDGTTNNLIFSVNASKFLYKNGIVNRKFIKTMTGLNIGNTTSGSNNCGGKGFSEDDFSISKYCDIDGIKSNAIYLRASVSSFSSERYLCTNAADSCFMDLNNFKTIKIKGVMNIVVSPVPFISSYVDTSLYSIQSESRGYLIDDTDKTIDLGESRTFFRESAYPDGFYGLVNCFEFEKDIQEDSSFNLSNCKLRLTSNAALKFNQSAYYAEKEEMLLTNETYVESIEYTVVQ